CERLRFGGSRLLVRHGEALRESLFAQLLERALGLLREQSHTSRDFGRLRELHLAVVDDLDDVAPRIADPKLPTGRSRGKACLAPTVADGFFVVDDETEVPAVVRPLPAALGERDELVAEVDERHAADATAQLDVAEDALPERDRLV